ncbi:PEP-CTERM sorting domain-containing protein [Tychonema sp. BBK16]|uniref:PEP-CTERM sorting domain-containing protein n=1 Tax=Tychonema sp. BBK16 TaxID=2699888 RepID=UPI001F40284A|nr:PEP-CTERM sorting domain-containing protein [Tychonema sp. BBK16]MCF6371775.1 PEP-CTERM sorting domain-containing protein [Tychonema sp. BBK16]
MNVYQKLGIVGGSLSVALVSQCFSVQAATLTQTYTVDLGSQPLNSSMNVVLPKFNSLLGTLLKAYVTVKSTVNNSVSITPLTGDFTGTATTNASIAVNIPLLKVDPILTLSVLASPPETKIANGGTGSVSGSASGTVSKSYDSQQSLSALSGCDGDTFIAGLMTTGLTQIQGNPARGNFAGLVSANTTLSGVYEYEPHANATVPEPMTAFGTFVAAGMGLWWKKRDSKKL